MGAPAPVLLMRQTDALPLFDVLHEVGAPTGKILARADLPESFGEGRDGFIPFRTMLHFCGLAAQSQDIADLCWRGVQRASHEHLGGWGEAVARCATSRRAILTFCERFKRDAPLMDLGLHFEGEYVWFWRSRPKKVIGWVGDEEGQQYALAAMIRVVRSVAGPNWTPSRIRLESTTAPWLSNIAELANVEIELGHPVVAIAVPYDLLDRPSFWMDADERKTPNHSGLLEAEDTLAGSLQQAFMALLPAVHPSIEAAAEIAEVTPSTLRRRLADEGTSWRTILEQARLEVCLREIRDPERPLVEIAAQLRYSDAAHFTRAFHRWMGESPSSYRARLTSLGALSTIA